MFTSVDATQLKNMILCASSAMNARKEEINDLNVFPVPDGDTGTNMCLTIGAASADLKKSDFHEVTRVADTIASAMLRGARGNSGVILSLLFRGFSRSLKGNENMSAADFAGALTQGVNAAYKAVMKPAEGTILTVSRLAAEAAENACSDTEDINAVMEAAISQAKITLGETTEMNPVLKKAGVVDAGGMGFIVILEAMHESLNGKMPEDFGSAEEAQAESAGTFSQFETEDITFTYCTEFIVERNNKKDPSLLNAYLENRGDCIVVVDDDEIIKVHVHTNNPGTVLEEALTYGQLIMVKVENMRKQHTAAVISEQEKKAANVDENQRRIAPAEKKYGFVSVCAGEGLEAMFRDLGADGIISGGQTMNPSTEDIIKEIDNTPAEIVFVLPNNKNIIMAAQQCVSISSEKKVIVIESRTVPEGVAAMLAYDPDMDEESLKSAMLVAAANVTTAQMTYAARDSEFDGRNIRAGDYMSLIGGKLKDVSSDREAIVKGIADEFASSGAEFINVYYGEGVSEEEGKRAADVFSESCPDAEVSLLYGGQPVYYLIVSAE